MSTDVDAERVVATDSRPAGVALVLAGLGHLVAPGVLLWLGGLGYDAALNVDFDPQDGAKRRVRLAGLTMMAAGAHLWYHEGVRP